MDVGRVGSLFIRGLEEFSGRNESYFTLTFREPFDAPRLLESFEALIRSRPSLRMRFVESEREVFAWASFEAAEVEERLAAQRLAFETGLPLEAAFADHADSGEGLPLRLRRIDERRVVLVVNHAFANGLSALYWIEQWLRAYDGEAGAKLEAPDRAVTLARSPLGAARGLAAVAAYAGSFMLGAGRDPSRATVDLSRGRRPEPRQPGCAVKTFSLPRDQTERLRSVSRQRDLSVSEALCAALAAALFEAQPEKSRVCLSVPTALCDRTPGASRDAPGNYTGSVILQIGRDRPLDAQVRAGLRWARRGVDYWLPWLLGSLNNERRLLERFRRQAALPIPARAPFENFSAAVSSVGVVRGPQALKHLAAVSAHTGMQTIFLCAMTLHDQMSVEVSAPPDLFEAREVFGVVERAIGELTTAPAPARPRAAAASS